MQESEVMAREFLNRVAKIVILPKGEPLFSGKATFIEVIDEAAGEFVEITQHEVGTHEMKIRIDDDEWPHIREAINGMFKDIKKHENKS